MLIRKTMEMERLQEIIKDYESILQDDAEIDVEINEFGQQIDHRILVCDNTDKLLAKADESFSELTSVFNNKDLAFLELSTRQWPNI